MTKAQGDKHGYKITALIGQLVRCSVTTDLQESQIDVSDLPYGIYHISINDSDGKVLSVSKLIKE